MPTTQVQGKIPSFSRSVTQRLQRAHRMSGIMGKLKKHVTVLKQKLKSCHHEANNLNGEVCFNQKIMYVNPKITTLQKAQRGNGK